MSKATLRGATSIKPDSSLCKHPAVISSRLDDEIVMMDPGFSKYFGLKAAAVRIWELLDSPISFANLVAQLTDEFEVESEQCAKDIAPFISELVEHGMVVISDE